MSTLGAEYNITQTFIIEPVEGVPVFSACTGIYSNILSSCSGNTNIFLGEGVISFDGNIYTNDNLTASTIHASAIYSAGTNVIDIINLKTLSGGTFDSNSNVLTLGQSDGTTISVSGFKDYYTTGTTLIGHTVYFNRNDTLSAYTLNLSSFSADTYVTGVTFTNNDLIIARNDGVHLNTFINTFTGLTINGTLSVSHIIANSISANTISATTFYGDGSNLTGLSTKDTYVTGGTYNSGTATFTNNTGGTFNVTGFYTGYTAPIDIRVTGGTYNAGTAVFTNNTGGTFSVTGFNTNTATAFTGGTVTGNTLFTNGVSANTISATTYLGLPIDIRVTGGTYSNGTTTFTNNTGGTFSVTGPSLYAAGPISGSTNWSDPVNGQINLPQVLVGLYNNPNFIEPLLVYSIASGTTGSNGIPSLSNNETNYVVIDYNSGSPRYNVLLDDSTINNSSIILFMIIYRANNFIHVLEFNDYGAGLSNRLNDRVIKTNRFARESGLILSLSGSGVVVLSSGVVWDGPYRQSLHPVDSTTATFFKNFHSGGTWVYTTTGTSINNTYYDNGTNAVSATTGYYLVNWYYRGQEIHDHIYEVYGVNQYPSVALAELATVPQLPELVSSHAFLTGRIIVGVGQVTGYTESAFVTVFQPTQVTLHNDLGGLQGGGTGEYYHLNASQHNNIALLNTDNVFQGGLSANTISATTYLNTPYWISGSTGNYSIRAKNDSSVDAANNYAVAEGYATTANGVASHSEGGQSTASGDYGHAEGYLTTASAPHAHAEGNVTIAAGDGSHSEGQSTAANGQASHAEGYVTLANGFAAHSEGGGTTANGNYSHAEGNTTTAIGDYSHSGGYNSMASGTYSFVHGSNSIASGTNTVVLGANITGTTDNTAYVPYMNIKYLSGGTSINNLGIDANGYVVVGSAGTLFTGGTVTGATYFNNGLSANTFSATTYLGLPTDIRVTGGTYSNGTAVFTNNTGGTFSVSGFSTPFTGGTVTGATIFTNGLSATTISATTYQNLPTDIRVTGGTYSSGTAIFTNNTGGTFNVTGFSTGGGSTFTGGTINGATIFTNGLTANTISATTYQNLPVTADSFTTAFTYSNNVFTIGRNQGLSTLTATINTVTGFTINGALTVTGASALNGTISSTSLTGTTDRLVEASSGGTVTSSKQIVTAYLTSGGTIANLLETTSNWDIDGNYTGSTITGTYQGQKHYNPNYFFEAVADNVFIRLIRG